MKVDISRTTSSNLKNSVNFKVTENASKLFSMLSTILYSNKEVAVLHELSSNAIDAQRLVGKGDVPIEVVMPTTLNPNVVIKDCGPGLSHDGIVQFLTSYGESSKQNSDEFIGGYGIGSKSPAAVTDTWTVISKHQGTLRHYMIVIGSEGLPTLTLLRETDTEESGLEVHIPIKPRSEHVWYEAARKVYEHYEVKPKFHGKDIAPPTNKILYSGQWFSIVECYERFIKVVSAGRGYGVDGNKIDNDLYSKFKSLDNSIIINVDIGEVDFDLSRENLRYTQKTIDLINKKLASAFDEIKADIQKRVDDTNRVNFCKSLVELYDKFSEFAVSSCVPNKFDVTSIRDARVLFIRIDNPKALKCCYDGKIRSNFNRTFNLNTCVDFFFRSYNANNGIRIKIGSLDKVVFVVDDGSKNFANRLRHLSNQNIGVCYIISKSFDFVEPDILECITVVAGKSIPDCPKKQPSTRVKVERSPFYKLAGRRFYIVESTEEQLYKADASLVAWTEITNPTSIDYDLNKSYTSKAKQLGIRKIIAVKSGSPHPTWCRSVKEVVDTYLTDNIDVISKNLISINIATFFDVYNNNISAKLLSNVCILDGLDSDSHLKVIYSKLRECKSFYEEKLKGITIPYKVRDLFNLNDIDLTTHPDYRIIKTLEECECILTTHYPMLKFCARYIGNNEVNDVVAYAKLVEANLNKGEK